MKCSFFIFFGGFLGFNFNYFKKFDFESVLKFSTIGLLKQKNLFKELIKLGLVSIVIIFFALMAFVSVLIGSYFSVAGGFPLLLIISIIFSIIFIICTLFLGSYFSYLIYSFALKSLHKKPVDFSISLGIKLIISGLLRAIISIFSLYEIKLFFIGLTGVILSIIGVWLIFFNSSEILFISIGLIFFIISLILLFIYYIIVVRNSTRLLFTGIILIQKNSGVKQALKKSWEITAGKAVLVFLIQLILFGVIVIVQQLLVIPLQLIIFLFLSSFSQPLLMVLFFIGLILMCLFFIAFSILFEMIPVFAQVKLYSQIETKKLK